MTSLWRRNRGPVLTAIGIGVLTLHPWILFGLRGPDSDGDLLVLTAAAKYGLVTLPWNLLLFTSGPGLFITPLLHAIADFRFFWIGSLLLALSSLVGTWGFWYVLKTTLPYRGAALAALLALAFHPFLHQLHFYWMTEWGYIVFLFLAIHRLSRYLEACEPSQAAWAGVWMALSLLMRPQALLFAYFGVAAFLIKEGLSRQAGKAIVIFCGCAFLVTLPFRVLNFWAHGSWSLNQTLGFSAGWYLRDASAYRPSNGPASRQLEAWAKELLAMPKPLSAINSDPWVKEQENFLLGYAGSLVNENQFAYVWPKYAHYFFTRDWCAADQFVVRLFKESVRADPMKYIRWTAMTRWYFTGKSENPEEWQLEFRPNRVQPVKKTTLRLERGEITGYSIGGLAFQFPGLLRAYHAARSVFASTMTWLKKLTFVSLPLLLWLAWRRLPRASFLFLALAVPTHLASGLALGMLVGFHHRYSVPFEAFTIYYAACWISLGLGLWIPRSSKYFQ